MSNAGSSSLRPAWKGGRGFQPPPTVTSDTRGRSSSIASSDGGNKRESSNKFSALSDDDDFISVGGKKSRDRERHQPNNSNDGGPKQNSRGESFRSSFGGSAHGGAAGGGGGGGGAGPRNSKGGRSLADLASKVPEGVARSASTGYAPEVTGAHPRGGRRYSTGDPTADQQNEPPRPQRSYEPSDYKKAVDASVVIRYTREKLLALRPRPKMDVPFPPDHLKDQPAALFSDVPQDPVCWDTFDSDEIWAAVPARRPAAPPGKPGGPRGEEAPPGERRRSYNTSAPGRWQRGQALPPSEERRKDKDADNPSDLWDDPVGGVTGAALDFSAFGDMADGGSTGSGDAFDFDKMTEATRKFEEELHGPSGSTDEDDIDQRKVDMKRPLATVGTAIRAGSGDGANVFEDFDAPEQSVNDGATLEQPAVVEGIQSAVEDPSASSRLMAMIGVKKEGGANLTRTDSAGSTGESPWNGNNGPSGDVGLAGLGGGPGSNLGLSLNPWGDPIAGAPPPAAPQNNNNVGLGMDLASRLESFAAEQKARESADMEQKELRRRRLEQDDAQRHAMAQQQQAQERSRQQQGMQQQQQQQNSPQSQVEAVLMERISTILENSWGRSDLVSILSTLHAEDSRVIPLLGSVDLLRELIAHNPRRVTLRQDPSFGAEMAVLTMTNAQWQQHEQARVQQEEVQRREEQIRMENIQRQRSMSSDGGGAPRINPDAPWFYSDPQGNIQGPFRGDEMRQWLEAGYFKGDLPISQQAGGPFIALSSIFQDLHVAFKVQNMDNSAQEAQEAENRARAEDARMQRERRQAEDFEREREMERQRHANEQVRQEQAARDAATAQQREQQEREEAASAAAAEAAQSNGANQPSNQLKMMLGLSQPEQGAETESAPLAEAPVPAEKAEKGPSKNNNNQKPPAEPEEPQVPAKPAAPAWGGAAAAPVQTRKSMSEIQKEEARRAASVASQQGGQPRQPSSGWANVAATAGKAWAPGTVKPTAAAGSGPPPTAATRGGSQPAARPKAASASNSSGQQQISASGSNTAAEEFGTSMSLALESWCKDQMKMINGTDDLTLVSFCMTLNDATEIRQYLTTYLGSTAQVNKFATEFIGRTGGAPPKQEEWETPGSAKKGRKKKVGR